RNVHRTQHVRAAGGQMPTLNRTADSNTRPVLEVRGVSNSDPTALRTRDDCTCDCMLGVPFYRGRQSQRLVLRNTTGPNSNHTLFPQSECTSLVEHDCVHQPGLLQATAVAYQQSIPGTKRGGDCHDKRYGQTK